MKKKLIIFDLDGVLINSISNMRDSLKSTCNLLNIKISFNEYRKYLGLPFEKILKNVGIQKNIPKIKKVYSFFSAKKKIQPIINQKNLEAIKSLSKDYILAVFTSKDRKRTKLILKKYKFFKIIITSDDVYKGKPNPEGIYKILNKAKIKKKNCIYVGDSMYDYESAKKAKIDYLQASWGYDKKINKINKIKKINNFLQIRNYF